MIVRILSGVDVIEPLSLMRSHVINVIDGFTILARILKNRWRD